MDIIFMFFVLTVSRRSTASWGGGNNNEVKSTFKVQQCKLNNVSAIMEINTLLLFQLVIVNEVCFKQLESNCGVQFVLVTCDHSYLSHVIFCICHKMSHVIICICHKMSHVIICICHKLSHVIIYFCHIWSFFFVN